MPSEALRSAVDWLLDHQDAQGWWSGELETNVTMTAEHVLLLRFLGVSHDDIREGAIRHILGTQREDGIAGRCTTTARATSARPSRRTWRCACSASTPTQPQLRRALRVILDQGGLVEARVFTKIWLALFGIYPWDGVPSMPPELVRLPSWAPLNLYDFACWARGTIAPLLIVISRRPVRDLGVDVDEVIAPGTARRMHRVAGSGAFLWLDHAAQALRPPAAPAGTRRRRAASWSSGSPTRQEADGGWGGIQPPWVYSLIALQPRGHVARSSGDAARARGIPHDSRIDDERRMAPPGVHVAGVGHRVGDARAAQGRRPARSSGAAPRGRLAARRADHGRRRLAGQGAAATTCGGWAFEFDNDIYPDVDDTAVVVLALLESGGARDACRGRSQMRSAGAGRCAPATVPGRHSTRTTRARSCTSCRSPTSAPCSIRRPRT